MNASLRVLVIHPDRLARFSACQLLRGRGVSCTEADSIASCRRSLARETWDLIVWVTAEPGERELWQLTVSSGHTPVLVVTPGDIGDAPARVRSAGIPGDFRGFFELLDRTLTPPGAPRRVA